MFNISDYLKNFQNITVPHKTEREALKYAIREVLGVEIDISLIEIRNKTAYIKTKPALKSEIFMQKKNILEKASERAGENKITSVF